MAQFEKLNVKRVAKHLRDGVAGEVHKHADGRGLILVVTAPGHGSWVKRYQLHNREHTLGLGRAWAVTLAEAREKNKRAQALIDDGVDPVEQRHAERAVRIEAAMKAKAPPPMTFEQAARAHFGKHGEKWGPRHAAEWSRSLDEFAFPIIGKLPVKDVTDAHVLSVLNQEVKATGRQPRGGELWNARRVTAKRLRGRIETVLAFAKSKGWRTGDNPAALSALEHDLPTGGKADQVEHFAAMPFADVPAFYTKLREQGGTVAQALTFQILTAARPGEVAGAPWGEIVGLDGESPIWDIPAERMKRERRHRVPLVPEAVALLRSLPTEEGSEWLFLSAKPGQHLSVTALSRWLNRMGLKVTAHGFRSSFSDWAHEKTSFDAEVIDMSLAHKVKGKTEEAYWRSDIIAKRRNLMSAWAAYCTGTAIERTGNVVPLKSA